MAFTISTFIQLCSGGPIQCYKVRKGNK
jgi:hypothetical protein